MFTITNKVYDVLKFLTQVALPGVAVFYAAMAEIWGFPYVTEVPATIAALVLLLGTFLQISSATYARAMALKLQTSVGNKKEVR